MRYDGEQSFVAGRPEWPPHYHFEQLSSPEEVEALDGPPAGPRHGGRLGLDRRGGRASCARGCSRSQSAWTRTRPPAPPPCSCADSSAGRSTSVRAGARGSSRARARTAPWRSGALGAGRGARLRPQTRPDSRRACQQLVVERRRDVPVAPLRRLGRAERVEHGLVHHSPRRPRTARAARRESSRRNRRSSVVAARTGAARAGRWRRRARTRRCRWRRSCRRGRVRTPPAPASRRSWRSDSGASVPSTIMIEPPCAGGSGALLERRARARAAGAGRAARRSSRTTRPPSRCSLDPPRGAADAGLEAEAGGARAGAQRSLARLVRAGGGDRLERVLGPHGQRAGVREPAVEALAHDHVDRVPVARRLGVLLQHVPQPALPHRARPRAWR